MAENAREPDTEALVRRLGLAPHPEGGWYRRTWQHPDSVGGRPLASSIVYLLGGGDRSRWHRIDAVEQWHHYAGDPLELRVSPDGITVEAHVLGGDVFRDQEPQRVVPAGWWQSAATLGAYSLVGCTVTPAFTFEGFELASDGWEPGA